MELLAKLGALICKLWTLTVSRILFKMPKTVLSICWVGAFVGQRNVTGGVSTDGMAVHSFKGWPLSGAIGRAWAIQCEVVVEDT